MKRTLLSLAALAALAACGGSEKEAAPPSADETRAAPDAAPAGEPKRATPPPTAAPASRWDLQSSGEVAALALGSPGGSTAIRLFCPARSGTLIVNVPGFRPVGSEERLSIGSGGLAVALVADPRGDRARGGVSGSGPVPEELAAIARGRLSASYGAQSSGPHPAPPPDLARGFVAACREAPSAAPPRTHPCRVQEGKTIEAPPLRAIGTEPFWGARIEGRCVTYSHPDDQKGTRVWTRYVRRDGGGASWSGSLAGRRFELRIRPAPGCSDGMSDRRYPLSAELFVGGERRTGCAEPA